MSKTIKTIKCPQCGSTRVDQIREDHYRCRSCSTEFWLDSDDITIHHRHEYPGGTGPALEEDFLKKYKKHVYLVTGVFMFFVFVFPFISSLLQRPSIKSPLERALSADEDQEQYFWSWEEVTAFLDRKGQPVIMGIGTRRMSRRRDGREQETRLAVTVSPETKKLLKVQELTDLKSLEEATLQELSDGRIYLIINDRKIYEVNRGNYELREIVPQVEFPEVKELAKGISQIEFNHSDPDGLTLMTSLGKKYIFYPVLKKIYTENELWNAYEAMPPNPQVYTAFQFSTISISEYTEELIQLVKYQYRWQVGYPKNKPSFQWQKDYGGSGIFTDRDPYRKVFISDWSKQRSRLVSYKDFTPEAYYFSPEVLHYDDNQVFITYRPTVDKDAPRIYQCLDARTAEVKWTHQEDSDKEHFFPYDVTLPYGGGYILVGHNLCMKFSKTGTVAYVQETRSLLESAEVKQRK